MIATRSDATPTTGMVGKKYGHLTVLDVVTRKRHPAGGSSLMVLARCDCGRKTKVYAANVRSGANECRRCAHATGAAKSSRVLPSGDTYRELSRRTGIPINTINQRWLRGWPEKDLGLPVLPSGRRRAK